ncbi:hypothetical protein Ancab_008894 [Ancistrocladus abbreviatus]
MSSVQEILGENFGLTLMGRGFGSAGFKMNLNEAQTRSAETNLEGQNEEVVGYKSELKIAQIEYEGVDKVDQSKSLKSPRTRLHLSNLVGSPKEIQEVVKDNSLKSPERRSRIEQFQQSRERESSFYKKEF